MNIQQKISKLFSQEPGWPPDQLSELQARKYFTRLGLKAGKALALHEAAGLWERKDGERDWSNVSRHCLIEAARVEVFAEWLGLLGHVKNELILTAVLHDFNKKQEVFSMKEAASRGAPFVVYALYKMEGEKTTKLRESGFGEFAVRLACASGGSPETSLEVRRILSASSIPVEDLAFLVMYYTDAYTRDANWVEPARGEANDLDRRVQGNKKYGALDTAIIAERVPNEPLFKGKTASEVMGELGHEIERLLVKIIFETTGRCVEPLLLPEVIDEEIKKRIEAP